MARISINLRHQNEICRVQSQTSILPRTNFKIYLLTWEAFFYHKVSFSVLLINVLFRVYDLMFFDETAKIEAHESEVLCVEFSPTDSGMEWKFVNVFQCYSNSRFDYLSDSVLSNFQSSDVTFVTLANHRGYW